jgi:hypothetical protein
LGFDPFTTSVLTDDQKSALQEQYFLFGFQTEMGLPDFPSDTLPPIIELNQEGSTVIYNMVCKVFKVVDLQASEYGDPSWIFCDQSTGDAPWEIQFTVDLNLVRDSVVNQFALLPTDMQNEVKDLGEDMFSVQQLYLDLNDATLSTSFSVEGLDPTTTAYIYLTTVFLGQYADQIADEGGVMLGFGVTSDTPFPDNTSLIPTDLNFIVSSYKEDDKATDDYSAYTLNYLLMANDNSMPAAVGFDWNWVDKDNLTKFAGTTAINRDTFVEFLNALLSPTLNSITLEW